MKLRNKNAGVIGLMAACVAGCQSSNQQVWSSKTDSSMATAASDPSIRVGEQLPFAGATTQDLAAWKASAVTLLQQAAESTNALLRANAIEALQASPQHLPPIVRRGLGDENRAVRFVSAMTVGKLIMKDEASLLEPLLLDESHSVQAAAMYGLKRCGRQVDLTPLSAMLMSDNPEVKGNAALVLGEIGEPTAVRLLRHAAGMGLAKTEPSRRKVVELQLAEAMVKLGEQDELEVVRASLFVPEEQGELTALACQMCGELGDRGALPNLIDLARRGGDRQQSPEVRMAATMAIAQLEPAQAPLAVPAEYVGSTRFELRAQAAHTIAEITAGRGAPNDATLPYLSRLLNDANPLVQVAAAGGVLRARS